MLPPPFPALLPLHHVPTEAVSTPFHCPPSSQPTPPPSLPLFILAARGVNISLNSPLSFLPLYPGDKEENHDPSNLNGGHITIAHEIRKMLLVSSNTAYNRLYALIGQRRLNEAMHSVGLCSAHLSHRLSIPLSPLDNRRCEPVLVGVEGNASAFCLPPKCSSHELPPVEGVEGLLIGSAYIDDNGTKPIGLDEGHRLLLLEAMRQYPRESHNPRYADKKYTDDYCKVRCGAMGCEAVWWGVVRFDEFFLPGLCRVRPKESLHVYNKIGQAFGFTIDNAYILDIETGREFFLSLALYTNENGCLNDDKYEYDLAYDVAADVAEAIARALWDDNSKAQDQDDMAAKVVPGASDDASSDLAADVATDVATDSSADVPADVTADVTADVVADVAADVAATASETKTLKEEHLSPSLASISLGASDAFQVSNVPSSCCFEPPQKSIPDAVACLPSTPSTDSSQSSDAPGSTVNAESLSNKTLLPVYTFFVDE
ncbi:unnamed protein product [Closterium sp. NIES-65]|nr:unnamed protein product [Closterium sp. NIES-65]